MERLLSAVFLIFTENRPWRPEDHFCKLIFHWNVKGKIQKKEQISAGLWCPWTLACSCNWLFNFSCLSALLKNGHLASSFSDLGLIWQVYVFISLWQLVYKFLWRNESSSEKQKERLRNVAPSQGLHQSQSDDAPERGNVSPPFLSCLCLDGLKQKKRKPRNDFWVCAYLFDSPPPPPGAPAASTVEENSQP